MNFRFFASMIVASVITYVVAVFFVGQFNLAQVESMGAAVSMGDRLYTFRRDLMGMTTIYLSTITLAMVLGFIIAFYGFVRRWPKPWLWYPLAGFTAIMTLHLALNTAFGISAVAPTASIAGFLSQCVAGAIGGLAFYRLTRAS